MPRPPASRAPGRRQPGAACGRAAVAARAEQGQVQGAGHRGLRPAGVGRIVLARVAQHGAQRAGGRGAGDERRRARDQKAADPRRNPVRGVVEARRRQAEGAVARRAVADHAVHGVDRLVGEHAGKAQQQIPEDRRDHAVGVALRAALDRGPGDAVFVERLHVAADDVADRCAPRLDAGPEGARHAQAVVDHAALREEHGHQGEFGEPAPFVAAGEVDDEPARGGARTRHQRHGEDAPEHAAGRAEALPVEARVEKRHQRPDQADGMGQPPGIADRDVEDDGDQEDRRRGRPVEEHVPAHPATMENPQRGVNAGGRG